MKLAVGLGGIDVVPENIEQLIVGNLRRIVGHFDRLAVLGFVGGDGGVIGVFFASASVSDDCFGHAFHVIEWFLHAPKTAASENRRLGFGATR